MEEIKKELETVEETVEEVTEAVEEKAEVVEEAVEECEPTVDEIVEEISGPVEQAEEVVEEAAEEVAEEAPTEESAEPEAVEEITEAAPAVEEVVAEEAPAEEVAEETVEEKPKALGKRILSAIFGATGILTSYTSVGGIIFGLISIILGFSAKKKSGKGKFAITLGFIGLILGILFLAATIYLVYCLFVNVDWVIETFNLPQEIADTWNNIVG